MDDDTEPVGDFECGFGSRAVCDFEEEVVLDSEDERFDQCQTRQVKLANEPFIAKGAGAHDDVLELDIGDFDTNSSGKSSMKCSNPSVNNANADLILKFGIICDNAS